MIIVYSIAIYLASITVLHTINILTKSLMDMWILFTPVINTLFALYIILVAFMLMAEKLNELTLCFFKKMINIMINKIPKKINKLLYE